MSNIVTSAITQLVCFIQNTGHFLSIIGAVLGSLNKSGMKPD